MSVVLVALFGAAFPGGRLSSVNRPGLAPIAGGAVRVAFKT